MSLFPPPAPHAHAHAHAHAPTHPHTHTPTHTGTAAALAPRFERTLRALAQLPHLRDCLVTETKMNSGGDVDCCEHLSVFLSFLPPATSILPHCGPTNQRLRLHLPLRLPRTADGSASCCVLRVGGFSSSNNGVAGDEGAVTHRIVEWEEGKVLAFDDAYEHEVVCSAECHGAAGRLVLVADIMHPAAAVA